jgi:hypothetical protein
MFRGASCRPCLRQRKLHPSSWKKAHTGCINQNLNRKSKQPKTTSETISNKKLNPRLPQTNATTKSKTTLKSQGSKKQPKTNMGTKKTASENYKIAINTHTVSAPRMRFKRRFVRLADPAELIS